MKVTLPQPTLTLHISDVENLKSFAIHAAKQLAEKAMTPDEYHRTVIALEQELERINQLNGMKPEIEIGYRSIPRKFWLKVDAFVKELEQEETTF